MKPASSITRAPTLLFVPGAALFVALAMIGLSAKITEREQSGRTVYRVRLGPYETRDEAALWCEETAWGIYCEETTR